jgi:hypothetical protein
MPLPPPDLPSDQELPRKDERVELRIIESDLRAWRVSAVRAKQKLSEWIRHTCDERVAREQAATKKVVKP